MRKVGRRKSLLAEQKHVDIVLALLAKSLAQGTWLSDLETIKFARYGGISVPAVETAPPGNNRGNNNLTYFFVQS